MKRLGTCLLDIMSYIIYNIRQTIYPGRSVSPYTRISVSIRVMKVSIRVWISTSVLVRVSCIHCFDVNLE